MPTPICHLEINVKNLARAKKFYSKLMGWKISPMMPGYEMFRLGKDSGGALSKGKTGSRGMLPYFHVKSIEQTLKKAKALKTKIVVPKTKIVVPKTEIGGGHGFFAQIRDSEGNTIGLWNKR